MTERFFITPTNNCWGYPKGSRVVVRILGHSKKKVICKFRTAGGTEIVRKLEPQTLQSCTVSDV